MRIATRHATAAYALTTYVVRAPYEMLLSLRLHYPNPCVNMWRAVRCPSSRRSGVISFVRREDDNVAKLSKRPHPCIDGFSPRPTKRDRLSFSNICYTVNQQFNPYSWYVNKTKGGNNDCGPGGCADMWFSLARRQCTSLTMLPDASLANDI